MSSTSDRGHRRRLSSPPACRESGCWKRFRPAAACELHEARGVVLPADRWQLVDPVQAVFVAGRSRRHEAPASSKLPVVRFDVAFSSPNSEWRAAIGRRTAASRCSTSGTTPACRASRRFDRMNEGQHDKRPAEPPSGTCGNGSTDMSFGSRKSQSARGRTGSRRSETLHSVIARLRSERKQPVRRPQRGQRVAAGENESADAGGLERVRCHFGPAGQIDMLRRPPISARCGGIGRVAGIDVVGRAQARELAPGSLKAAIMSVSSAKPRCRSPRCRRPRRNSWRRSRAR